jgi:hypothetical protein
MKTLYCSRCKQNLPAESFYLSRTSSRGYGTYCKECSKARRREWMAENKEMRSIYHDRYKDSEIEAKKGSNWRLRIEFLREYGNECACCGEFLPEFLSVDHINNDGEKHRQTLSPNDYRGGNGRDVIRDLKRRGWPKEDYQILCYNCNFAKGWYGECPHERIKADIISGNIGESGNGEDPISQEFGPSKPLLCNS